MAERVGYRDRAVGVEAGLVADGVGYGDRAVTRVAPIAAVLAASEDIIQYLINQRPGVKGNGSAKDAERGLHDGQRAPRAGVGVVDAACSHVEREIVARFPPQRATVGRTPQERHRSN